MSTIVGLCTLELQVPASSSLKDKRRVVRSVRDRLRSKFNVSVAEVGELDSWQFATIALVCVSGCMSLMFPTIFGLGCSDLGEDTKLASSGQIMAIVGGAIITPMQGWMVDKWGVSNSYLLPLLCFVVIGLYGITSRKVEQKLVSA